jgi:hypothetical protein
MITNEMASGTNTGWELEQLLNTGRLPETDIYVNGEIVQNPFGD